eukprot:m51a1_g3537 hypothetical protein (216) ;mRNA; f:972446-973339
MVIKALALDLGGVFFAEGKAAAMPVLRDKYGYDPVLVQSVLTGPHSDSLRKGLIEDDAFWKWVETELNTRANGSGVHYDASIVRSVWYDAYTVDEGVRRIALEAKALGCRLVVFTGNIRGRIQYLQAHHQFEDLFDAKVYSYDHHMSKAQPDFHKEMIKASGCKPSEIIYVDDDPKHTKIASELGVNCFTYRPSKVSELREFIRGHGVPLASSNL